MRIRLLKLLSYVGLYRNARRFQSCDNWAMNYVSCWSAATRLRSSTTISLYLSFCWKISRSLCVEWTRCACSRLSLSLVPCRPNECWSQVFFSRSDLCRSWKRRHYRILEIRGLHFLTIENTNLKSSGGFHYSGGDDRFLASPWIHHWLWFFLGTYLNNSLSVSLIRFCPFFLNLICNYSRTASTSPVWRTKFHLLRGIT